MNLVRSLQMLGRLFVVLTPLLGAACTVQAPLPEDEATGASYEALLASACPGSPGACAEFPFQFPQQAEPAWGDQLAMTQASLLPKGTGFETNCRLGDGVCALERELAALNCSAGGRQAWNAKTARFEPIRRFSRASTLGSACNQFFLWGSCPVSDGLAKAVAKYGPGTCPGVMLRVDFYYETSASGGTTIYCPTAVAVAGNACRPWPAGVTAPRPTWTAVMDWDPLCSGCRLLSTTRQCLDTGGQLVCSGDTIYPAGNY